MKVNFYRKKIRKSLHSIKQQLFKHQLGSGAIELEITEGILMENHQYSFQVIENFKNWVDFFY